MHFADADGLLHRLLDKAPMFESPGLLLLPSTGYPVDINLPVEVITRGHLPVGISP